MLRELGRLLLLLARGHLLLLARGHLALLAGCDLMGVLLEIAVRLEALRERVECGGESLLVLRRRL